MVVGVNGTGKTTTIGKLTSTLKKDGVSVMLVAADTFRAAAIEQLEVWSQRVDAPLIKQKTGADPSAVVFDAIVAAKARKADTLIIDTAGRLHTKVNLMEELKKMKRIIERELPDAPHEILLVLDATTGQNAVVQARMFNDEIGVTGIILTKLDGTAKGGVIIGIARELSIPIRYIGIGERLDDLKSFKSAEFVDALFEQDAR
jgi:fused signal recognition particle receptor